MGAQGVRGPVDFAAFGARPRIGGTNAHLHLAARHSYNRRRGGGIESLTLDKGYFDLNNSTSTTIKINNNPEPSYQCVCFPGGLIYFFSFLVQLLNVLQYIIIYSYNTRMYTNLITQYILKAYNLATRFQQSMFMLVFGWFSKAALDMAYMSHV